MTDLLFIIVFVAGNAVGLLTGFMIGTYREGKRGARRIEQVYRELGMSDDAPCQKQSGGQLGGVSSISLK